MREEKRLPGHVTATVGAICRGYAEREQIIRRGVTAGVPYDRYAECLRLNGSIDAALAACPDDITRQVVKKALIEGLGFDSVGICYCGKNQFYRRKNAVKRDIARRLHLI